MQKHLLVFRAASSGTAENEECFFHLRTINCDRSMLLRIGRKPAAIFEFVFIFGRLIVIPNPPIAVLNAQFATSDGRRGAVGARNKNEDCEKKDRPVHWQEWHAGTIPT